MSRTPHHAYPSVGWADPSDEAAEAVLREQLLYAVSLLRPKDEALLDALYGLTDDPVPAVAYAKALGIERSALAMRRKAALRRLAGLMRTERRRAP